MQAFIALLRGVNVGKAKRVLMADWRAQLEQLGYTDVVTLLNSGNAVFRAARAPSRRYAAAIASAMEKGLKIRVQVVVKSSVEFAAIVAENPFGTTAGAPSTRFGTFTIRRLLVSAIDRAPTERFRKPLIRCGWNAPERIAALPF